MAEEYKSILSDQEHLGVQPVSPYDVPILLNDNALTLTLVVHFKLLHMWLYCDFQMWKCEYLVRDLMLYLLYNVYLSIYVV